MPRPGSLLELIGPLTVTIFIKMEAGTYSGKVSAYLFRVLGTLGPLPVLDAGVLGTLGLYLFCECWNIGPIVNR